MKMPASLYEKLNGSAPDIKSGGKITVIVKNKPTVQTRVNLPLADAKPIEAPTIPGRPSYRIFTITLLYLQQLHQLKVMKVSRDYGSPIYKIVLSSTLNSNGWVCWLQQQSKNWHLLLGNDIDETLIAAIGSAIGFDE